MYKYFWSSLGQSGIAGTAWDKYWNSLSSASQLGTLLGELGFWESCPVLSSTGQGRVGLLIGSLPDHYIAIP